MTPERAKEILKKGNRWHNWEKFVSAEEDREIKSYWSALPGNTSWYDALVRISKGLDTVRGYNGWTNYETWNVHLWVTNEESTSRYVSKNGPYTADGAESLTRTFYPKGTPDFDSPKDYEKVAWDEIAEAYNEIGNY